MKILTKNITVGDYNFDVSIDRDITVDAFEQFPELMEFLFSNANTNKDGNGNEIVINAIHNKKLGMLLDTTEQIANLVRYAFPKMLTKADNFRGTDNATKCEEILTYIIDNEVDAEFNNAMFEFICLGFTPDTTEKKPKVKFVMK